MVSGRVSTRFCERCKSVRFARPESKKEELESKWKELNSEVIRSGGLHVIGTERNESRRMDNQLRGRSGRQGDPGSSRFYISLEDNLMRIFASDQFKNIMQRVGLEEGESIEDVKAKIAENRILFFRFRIGKMTGSESLITEAWPGIRTLM